LKKIERIVQLCPNLEDLTIDIAKSEDGELEKSIFYILAGVLDLGVARAIRDGNTSYQAYYNEGHDTKQNPNGANPFSSKNDFWIENI
jgi:hypothetical protein